MRSHGMGRARGRHKTSGRPGRRGVRSFRHEALTPPAPAPEAPASEALPGGRRRPAALVVSHARNSSVRP
ncbi:hypothetical protein FRAHR75_1350004 [Frankia sp. Hr75.2]|nr:hypothetical protein FRAHR75_1350004 [Frankia sp. Hr75.2]